MDRTNRGFTSDIENILSAPKETKKERQIRLAKIEILKRQPFSYTLLDSLKSYVFCSRCRNKRSLKKITSSVLQKEKKMNTGYHMLEKEMDIITFLKSARTLSYLQNIVLDSD